VADDTSLSVALPHRIGGTVEGVSSLDNTTISHYDSCARGKSVAIGLLKSLRIRSYRTNP